MSETEMNKFESLSSCLVITEFMVANLITYSANILSSFKVSDRYRSYNIGTIIATITNILTNKFDIANTVHLIL